MNSERRYLFILMGSLGDVVRGLYLVNALKDAEPGAHITWLVEPACSGIVRLHPRIDEILVFDRPRGLAAAWELRKELAKRDFDITFDLQRHLKSGLCSWFSGSPRRIGFHRLDAKEGNWLFNTECIAAKGETISKIDHYFLFLEKLGIAAPERVSSGLEGITLESISAPWVTRLTQPYMACILGSSWDSKDWPEEGYSSLLEQFPDKTIVLLSDKTKLEMAGRLERVVTRANVVNLAGQTSLAELVAVIQGARVCMGPDSGPGHIAGAVGTPHITLFGPTPVARNTPRGGEDLALYSQVGCSPCKRRVCPGLGKVCMKLIAPEAVLHRAVSFF